MSSFALLKLSSAIRRCSAVGARGVRGAVGSGMVSPRRGMAVSWFSLRTICVVPQWGKVICAPETVVLKVDVKNPEHRLDPSGGGRGPRRRHSLRSQRKLFTVSAPNARRSAVARIFEAKGRPATNPVIVHASNASGNSKRRDELAGDCRKTREHILAQVRSRSFSQRAMPFQVL